MTDVLLPKGLERMLEPTIGNHDKTFLDNYSKLKKFFVVTNEKHLSVL